MSHQVEEAIAWWYSDECSRMPTVVDAREYVVERWGKETLDAMIQRFIENLRSSTSEWRNRPGTPPERRGMAPKP